MRKIEQVVIVSDDFYFCYGMLSAISARDEGVQLIVRRWSELDEFLIFSQFDKTACARMLFILDIEGADERKTRLRDAYSRMENVIYFSNDCRGVIDIFGCQFHVIAYRKMLLPQIALFIGSVIRQNIVRRDYDIKNTMTKRLTHSESIVLELWLKGIPTSHAAEALGVSIKTISNHKRSAINKIGGYDTNQIRVYNLLKVFQHLYIRARSN